MTEKRFEMIITGADGSFHYLDKNTGEKITSTLELENKLNELHEENQSLKFDNKELIRFIKSKGYTLKDYIKFIGQFQSVGVNKEDWE